MSKAELRRRIREDAAKHVMEERCGDSAKLCTVLRSELLWKNARSVLLFSPMRDEPDVSPLLVEAINTGKQLGLPAYSQATGVYHALQVRDLKADLNVGQFGIMEPCVACSPMPLGSFDLALVPGLAFTRTGIRLGRGKGFYDRLLAQIPGAKCGVAFDWQIVDEIPSEPHDVKLGFIVTPSRLLVA